MSEKRKRVPAPTERDVWTSTEKQRFDEALKHFAGDWKQVQELVQSKSLAQVTTYAKKVRPDLFKRGRKAAVPNRT